MARVILFGSGDAGGLIISGRGVRRIPPFDPIVRAQLKAVEQLVLASSGGDAGATPTELEQITTRLASLAVEQVEAIFGTLEPDNSLVVFSDDGNYAFACGSSGKPPLPLPSPPRGLPPVVELLSRGGIDRSLADFVDQASSRGKSLKDLLDNPIEVASELGVELTERAAKDLSAMSRLDEISDPVAREVVGFFRAVLDDGRFVDDWTVRPSAVANKLEVELSDSALDRIAVVGSAFRPPSKGGEAGIIWIVVAIVVGVIVIADEGEAEFVDRSLTPKF